MKKEKKNKLQFRPVLFKNCQAFFKHSFPVYFKLAFRLCILHYISVQLLGGSIFLECHISISNDTASSFNAVFPVPYVCIYGFFKSLFVLSLPCLIASSIVFFFSRSAIYFPYGFSTSKIISAVMLSFITPPILWSSSFTKSKALTVLSYLR